MTPERLRMLRDAPRSGLYLTTAEALELCDEVDRLRAGVEEIADIFDPIDYDELAGDAVHARGIARDLLSPTEGEDHD